MSIGLLAPISVLLIEKKFRQLQRVCLIVRICPQLQTGEEEGNFFRTLRCLALVYKAKADSGEFFDLNFVNIS